MTNEKILKWNQAMEHGFGTINKISPGFNFWRSIGNYKLNMLCILCTFWTVVGVPSLHPGEGSFFFAFFRDSEPILMVTSQAINNLRKNTILKKLTKRKEKRKVFG